MTTDIKGIGPMMQLKDLTTANSAGDDRRDGERHLHQGRAWQSAVLLQASTASTSPTIAAT
ncbi:hypothetical protein REMIM1_PE00158 (plasmid) [Rhizobium etli bv. mimosae str. Mim1]|nr:hypothetical protein REMIM1_PE00158 [Rhizobium etli bv. mimosae str. Mim1]